MRPHHLFLLLLLPLTILNSCVSGGGDRPNYGKPHPLGAYPSPGARSVQIANEPKGNFFYGRRYFVNKTRFWGYIRKPGQSWDSSKLVLMNEDRKRQPDRMPESGPYSTRYAFDQNYEYKIFGSFSGKKIYDPNSDLFLPEFRLTGYQLLNKKPGWIFTRTDHYDPSRITLRAY